MPPGADRPARAARRAALCRAARRRAGSRAAPRAGVCAQRPRGAARTAPARPRPPGRRWCWASRPGCRTRPTRRASSRVSFRGRAPSSATKPRSDALHAHAGDADVIHLACHAQFRSDNPMFSALHLADGALTVEAAEALSLKACTVVLSACETALAEQRQRRRNGGSRPRISRRRRGPRPREPLAGRRRDHVRFHGALPRRAGRRHDAGGVAAASPRPK